MASTAVKTNPALWERIVKRVKAGSKGGDRGEWSALSSSEYARTSRAKRAGTKKGKQFVSQPKDIAKKVRKYRQ